MRILIDTCVLYPTVMRQMVVGAAQAGAFAPLWSPRILEEWRRAAVKLGAAGQVQAEVEIATLRAAMPQAEVEVPDGVHARLWLPDDNDVHVLAAAVSASADAIMTLNAKDFPRGVLAEEGLSRVDPDSYLLGVWQAQPQMIEKVAAQVHGEAERLSAAPWQMRALLKKARLPRLAKALS